MKIVLGTAQLGMAYGISNQMGQTCAEEAVRILSLAKQAGIKLIDTAAAYGNSEIVLGNISISCDFNMVTKTVVLKKKVITTDDIARVIETFQQSLKNLRLSKVYGLLVHHMDDLLLGGPDFYQALLTLKRQGLVEKIGVSIYTEAQLEQILTQYPIDIVQLPLNVFDQRFLQQNYLKKLKAANIEIHARSVFLQGLLLMPITYLPSHFADVLPHIKRYQQFVHDKSLTLLQAAFSFVASIPEIDYMICGVNTHEHLQELLQIESMIHIDDFAEFHLMDTRYINPTEWVLR